MDKEIIIDSSRMSGITTLRKKIECLKQENEELKTCDQTAIYKRARINFEKLNKYKQALEEIEKELKEDITCESRECGCDDYGECLKCIKETILNRINEVNNER